MAVDDQYVDDHPQPTFFVFDEMGLSQYLVEYSPSTRSNANTYIILPVTYFYLQLITN